MASSVPCDLKMDEIDIPPIITAAGGMIKILLAEQQQQESSNTTTECGEKFIPQHAEFYIPFKTLFDQESCEDYIWDVLSLALNINDCEVCDYLTHEISAFAAFTAERNGVKGFGMVAEVCLQSDS